MKDLKFSLIIAAVDKATGPLRRVGGVLKGLESGASKLGQSFHRLSLVGILGGGAAIGAAAAAGAGLFALTKRVADMGEHAEVAAQKTGLSTTELQRFEYAAKMAGVEASSLDTATRMMAMHVDAAARGSKAEVRSLREFGVTIRDASGHLKPMAELVRDVSNAFSAAPDGPLKTAAAMKLFGRSGADLIPFLNKGAKQIDAWGDAAQALGLIIDKVGVEKAVQFERGLRSMEGALQSMQIKIGLLLLPVMTKLVNKLTDVFTHMKPEVVKKFTDSISKLVDQIPSLIDLFGQFLDLVADILPKFIKLTDKIGGLKTVLIALGVAAGVEVAANLLTLGGALLGLIVPIRAATASMFGLDLALDANPISLILLAIAAVIAALVFLAMHYDDISQATADFINNIGMMFNGGVDLVKKAWDGLTGFFHDLWGGIEDVFSSAWKRIEASTPGWLKTLLKIGAIGVLATNPPLAMAAAATLAPHAAAVPLAQRPALASQGAHSKVSGVIEVRAAPGTKVTKMSSSDNLLQLWSRGYFPG